MGLSIKNEETERLVRELARRKGVGVTTAIRLAVSNELEKTPKPKKSPEEILAFVREIQERWKAFPPIDMKEMDDFLYDENGLPH
ncbi:MAG: protein transcription factor [Alphaproteobacteria bacterium PA3]|jgi:antitoxin VapB|nr:MAG: protein transcription factor [Alphaproteobacteria bacterium PA3]